MIKYVSALLLLVGLSACHRDVGGVLPGSGKDTHCTQTRVDGNGHSYRYLLPECVPDPTVTLTPPTGLAPSGDMGVPAQMCGGEGQPCCVEIDTGNTSCNSGLVCDPGTGTCVNPPTPPDMSTSSDMTPLCSPGQTDCSGTCTDTTTDNNNCGQCGNVCSNGVETCVNGVCQPPMSDGGCGDMSIPPSCDYNQDCTFSYGYWKQHWVCSINDLVLGTVHYTNAQLLQVLNTPSSGSNDLIELAHQLIGAKMNIIKGANPASIQSTINAADALIGNLVVPSVGAGVLNSFTAVSLATTLANYNLGYMGSPHCP